MLPTTGQQSTSQNPSQGDFSELMKCYLFVMNILVKQYWLKISHCMDEAHGQMIDLGLFFLNRKKADDFLAILPMARCFLAQKKG